MKPFIYLHMGWMEKQVVANLRSKKSFTMMQHGLLSVLSVVSLVTKRFE